MIHASGQNSCRRLTKTIGLKILLLVLICLGLNLTGWPPGGPVPALAQSQEMIEPYEAAGPIDKIVNETIIIGDRTYRMSDVIQFYYSFIKAEEAPASRFSVGTQVGFTVNQFGEIEAMWLR